VEAGRPHRTLQTADIVVIERINLPWLGVDTSAATEHAVRRIRLAAGRSNPAVHTYQATQTALGLVAAGQGVALIPSLALRGADLIGIDALDVAGLGTRRIVLRRHDRRGVAEAVRVAASFIRDEAVAFSFDDDIHGRTS
jgi:DNA-binding transcriptional LysR family regulator